jgi:tripartite-type tricarboxylate transporter receptor subunit TctC
MSRFTGCLRALALLLATAAVASGAAHATPRTPTATELMDWAEEAFPGYFPQRPETLLAAPYLFRHHPASGNYLGIAGSAVWVLGPVAGSSTQPLYVGELSAFACEVHRYSCAAPIAWPARAVTLVVPFAAGGPTDLVARLFATALARELGGVVNVRNVTGSNGTTGSDEVAKATADGYTLLFNGIGMPTVTSLYRQPPHRPLQDFAFVGMVTEMPMVLIGRNSLPSTNFQQLRTWLQQRGGAARLAHAGIGSPSHLCALLLQQSAGLAPGLVSYRGSAPAITDLLGDAVDVMCTESITAEPYASQAQVRSFATAASARVQRPAFAALPTGAEVGLPAWWMSVGFGVYAPKGTPQPVLDKINGAVQAAVRDGEFQRRQREQGYVPIVADSNAPASHKRLIALEAERWAPVIQAGGQYID